jgi:hypothetical protein
VGEDLPTFFQDIPTVVTVTFAAETIEMVVATGDDDTMQTITILPSTVTLSLPIGVASTTGAAKEKRQPQVATATDFVTAVATTVVTRTASIYLGVTTTATNNFTTVTGPQTTETSSVFENQVSYLR